MGISIDLFVSSGGLDDLTCVLCHDVSWVEMEMSLQPSQHKLIITSALAQLGLVFQVLNEPFFIGCREQHAFCHDCLDNRQL
jgi:hypothetical protein